MTAALERPLFSPLFAFFLALAVVGCAAQPAAPVDSTVTVHHSMDLQDAVDAAHTLAERFGEDQVLVAFDMDNTLLAMQTGLGSDQWYDWQKELATESPCDTRLVIDRLAAQGALFHVGSMRPTQPDAAALVAGLQRSGFATLIVTARGQDYRLPTFRELRRNQLNFRDHTIGPTGGFADAYTPAPATRPVRFEDGVYMLAGQHKGDLLLALYETLGLSLPSALVFIDDKAKNVQAMSEAMIQAGIRAELFIYGRESVDQFDAERAADGWRQLRPALITVESVMGTANFDLPERDRQDCAH